VYDSFVNAIPIFHEERENLQIFSAVGWLRGEFYYLFFNEVGDSVFDDIIRVMVCHIFSPFEIKLALVVILQISNSSELW